MTLYIPLSSFFTNNIQKRRYKGEGKEEWWGTEKGEGESTCKKWEGNATVDWIKGVTEKGKDNKWEREKEQQLKREEGNLGGKGDKFGKVNATVDDWMEEKERVNRENLNIEKERKIEES